MRFFFSSRRRHTSFSRDWSSDVCSSDLDVEHSEASGGEKLAGRFVVGAALGGGAAVDGDDGGWQARTLEVLTDGCVVVAEDFSRSEERRVGKEGRVRGSPCERKKGYGSP